MATVLGREDDIPRRQAPVDAQRGVVPRDGALRFGGIEVVALVLEYSLVAQHREAVREAPRHEELPFVVPRELHGDVPPERGRAAADVHRDVQHAAPDNAHQLRLCMRPPLEVKPAKNAVLRHRLVVLHDPHGAYEPVEGLLRIALEEITPSVPEHLGFEEDDTFYFGRDDFHGISVGFRR